MAINKIFIVFVILLFSWPWQSVDIANSRGSVSEINKQPVSYGIEWHWENRFDREEVAMVKSWLTQVYQHSQNTLGGYPFQIHFYIHRSESGNEPVPWANTTRGDIQGVHFHINPEFGLQEFLSDWPAPHEISHLSIPFVGKENSWFSEGYATYMQVQILQNQGVYSVRDANEKYLSRFAKCKKEYDGNASMTETVERLKKSWNYPAIYWGGASFFWKLNRDLLAQKGISLLDVMKEYEGCCRVDESTPKDICEVFDQISHSSTATNLLIQYRDKPVKLAFEEF